MTVQEVSDYLQIPVATLYAYRSRGGGPKAARIGKHLRYRRADVDAWIDSKADDFTDLDLYRKQARK